MTELRKLCRRQKAIKTLNIILNWIFIVLCMMLFITGGISKVFSFTPLPKIILFTCIIITLAIMFLAQHELKDLKDEIKYEISIVIYSAFRNVFSGYVLDDEMFGGVDSIGLTDKQVIINIDVYNCNVDHKELVEAIRPTVKMLKRGTRREVNLYYSFIDIT